MSVLEGEDGSLRKFPHLFLDRGKPGCIAINAQGQRFGNESATNLVAPMHSSGSVPAYLVCDHQFIKRFGLGLVRPGGIGLKKMLRAGYLTAANTLEALAQSIGVDAENFRQTVDTFNGFASSGVDEDFGRGGQASDFAMGDANHEPNPCLGPIAQGPFYAVKIFPGDSTTTVGLKVDAEARAVSYTHLTLPTTYTV